MRTCLLAMVFGLAQSAYARDVQYTAFSDEPEALRTFLHAPPPGYPDQAPAGSRFGVTSHHLFAHELINAHFAALARVLTPRTVIIIGPDHDNVGRGPVSLSALPWKTPFGQMQACQSSVARLVHRLGPSSLDDEAIAIEHSIRVPMAFIAYYFPGAQVVPIIMKDVVAQGFLEAFAAALRAELDDQTYVLLSMDFSHGKAPALADRSDVASRAAIERRDLRALRRLDVDSPAGLYVLLRLAEGRTPVFGTHTNSARLSGIPGVASTTSYFNIFF